MTLLAVGLRSPATRGSRDHQGVVLHFLLSHRLVGFHPRVQRLRQGFVCLVPGCPLFCQPFFDDLPCLRAGSLSCPSCRNALGLPWVPRFRAGLVQRVSTPICLEGSTLAFSFAAAFATTTSQQRRLTQLRNHEQMDVNALFFHRLAEKCPSDMNICATNACGH